MPTPHPTRGVEHCKCGDPIRKAIDPSTGERLYVNAVVNPAGPLACFTDDTGTLRCRTLGGDQPNPHSFEWRAMRHFYTCSLPPNQRPRPAGRRRARRHPGLQQVLFGQPGGRR